MNEQHPGTEDIECDEIVYRALKKSWIHENKVTVEAFMRRNLETAVSLSRRKYSTARECREALKKMPSAGSLHVGYIRELPFGLAVQPDPITKDGVITGPSHCLLLNLPDPVTDSDNAEFVASQIAKIARLVTAEQEEEEHCCRRLSK